MKTVLRILFLLLLSCSNVWAQSGPWANSSAKLKGDALVRDSSGGYLAEVQSIVQGGGDVNWTLDGGLTPLLAAASGGHLEIVKFLLDKGADINHRDRWGQNALDRARASGASDVVRFLQTYQTASASNAAQPQAASAPTQPTPNNTASNPQSAARQTATASGGNWPQFGFFAPGTRVRFWVPTGWRFGTVKEVGSTVAGAWNEKKYFIASDLFPNSPEWVEWGKVAGAEPETYWTSFFVGNWNLGEGMAVNTSVSGTTETTEFAYRAATDTLSINPNGTYRWNQLSGRWAAASDGPGIVLQNGAEGATWTLRNETNAIEEGIRRIQSARLTTNGKMSVVATRKY